MNTAVVRRYSTDAPGNGAPRPQPLPPRRNGADAACNVRTGGWLHWGTTNAIAESGEARETRELLSNALDKDENPYMCFVTPTLPTITWSCLAFTWKFPAAGLPLNFRNTNAVRPSVIRNS